MHLFGGLFVCNTFFSESIFLVCLDTPQEVKWQSTKAVEHNFIRKINMLGKMPKKVKNGPKTGFLDFFLKNKVISFVWKLHKIKIFVLLKVLQKLLIQEYSSS